MRNDELLMFGCSKDDLDDMINDEMRPLMGGCVMLAMSIMSDAQECIQVEMYDRARQYLNRAKYVLHGEIKHPE